MENSKLGKAIEQREWEVVDNMIKEGVSDRERKFAVTEAKFAATETDFETYILPHCHGDQLGPVLHYKVTKGQWRLVDKMLTKGVLEAHHEWAVQQASKTASESDFEAYILPHCSCDQLETILPHIVTRGLWKLVGNVLGKGVSEVQHELAVQKAGKTANETDFETYILPHCSCDQLDTVLPHLVTRGLWKLVGNVLRKGVSETQHRWAVKEAMKNAFNAERTFFLMSIWSHILPCCKEDQLDDVLTHFRTVGLWSKDQDFKRNFLHLFKKCQMDAVLAYLVSRDMWKLVGKVLKGSSGQVIDDFVTQESSDKDDDEEEDSEEERTRLINKKLASVLPFCGHDLALSTGDDGDGEDDDEEEEYSEGRGCKNSLYKCVSDSQHTYAVEEGSKRACEKDLKCILPYCNKDQRNIALTHLVERGMWRTISKVLKKGVDPSRLQWTVEEASKKANTKRFKIFILPHCTEDLEVVVTNLVARNMWKLVGNLLQKGVGDSTARWVVAEGSKRADDTAFAHHIVPHCPRDQLDMILLHIVKRGLWKSVDKVLERGVRDRLQKWAVEEASMKAEDSIFLLHILRHCSEEQLHSLLTDLEIRGMWDDDFDFQQNVLKHFGRHQLDSLVVFLVAKGMWASVWSVLEKNQLSAAVQAWTVEETSKKADAANFEYIICNTKEPDFCNFEVEVLPEDKVLLHTHPDCQKDQFETVLVHLMKRGMWSSVAKVLEEHARVLKKSANVLESGSVDDSLRQWAVSVASKTANGAVFEEFMLSHCKDQEIESVLANLRKRGLLPCVEKVDMKFGRDKAPLHSCFMRTEVSRVQIYYQLAKTTDPFVLTGKGHSVLLCAARNEDCGKEMVAECIKLGLTTYQPLLTAFPYDVVSEIVNDLEMHAPFSPSSFSYISSPFLFTVVNGETTLAYMLYESGSCSYTELFYLHQSLPTILDPESEDGKRVKSIYVNPSKYQNFLESAEKFMPHLKEMAATPRSLLSSCRLVISHSLKVHERRYRDVEKLPLSQRMKDYVLFADLTDPDYDPFR